MFNYEIFLLNCGVIMVISVIMNDWPLLCFVTGLGPSETRGSQDNCTVSFSKDVFSQEAVNWVFLGLFH